MQAGAHLVTTNYETLGGPATAVLITASGKFRDDNPKAYATVLNGLREAIAALNEDKKAAARIYLEVARDTRNTADDIHAIISDKDYAYTLQPQKVLKTAQLMAKIGTLKQSPRSIDELFFPEVGALPGD